MHAPFSKAGSPSSKPKDKTRKAPRPDRRALALAVETEERWTDALLHRIRGDILLKAVPTDPAPAEQAFLAAIAVGREQGARSFCLQAALKLAKLYRSTGRPPTPTPCLRRCSKASLDSGVTGDRGSTSAARGAGGDRTRWMAAVGATRRRTFLLKEPAWRPQICRPLAVIAGRFTDGFESST